MSARALQRIVVRMLFDATYAERVVATPADALAGEDLTEEERSWLASSDPRAWRADSGRPSRALTVLAQEYPTSLALCMATGGAPGQPIGFFSSLEFHLCVRGRGSMSIAFGDYLIALSLKGALSDRRLTHLVRLEQAIARLRRAAPAVAPATGGSGSLLQRSPDKALHEAAGGTADLHDEIYADLPGSGAELAAAVLSPGRAAPCTQVDPVQNEPLILELAHVSKGYAEDVPVTAPGADSAANAPVVAPATASTKPATTEQDNRLLKEMVVSADKDKPVQQRTELGKLTVFTPVSGAVVSKEELEHLQLVNNLLELGKRVPGISMVRNMRIPDGGKQYTETRVDGMRAIALNTSGLDGVELGSVERIDVITGPASALYGTGALGGTISVTSRQPPESLAGKASQEFGSWGFKRTKGNVGTTKEDGRFGFIVTASNMNFDGWRNNGAATNANSASESKNGNGIKAFFRPAETTKMYAGFDQLTYDYRWAGPISMPQFNQDWRQTLKGAYGETIDIYNTKSLRLQQFVGERGELNISWGQISNDSTNYGGAGSGSSNNVICDDGSTAAGTSVAAGATVRCSAVNHGVFANGRWSNAAVTNTLKYGFNRTTTTTAVYRHEFDLAKSTLYAGTDIYETIADSATYSNVYNAIQAQAGYWARGLMTSPGSMTIRRESTPFVHFEFSPMDRVRLHLGERIQQNHGRG